MIYFLLYLFIETFVSVEIASAIGPIWTFIEIIVSAVAGFYILMNYQYKINEYLFAVAKREITLDEFESMSIYTLIGAILLIIPGFFTDILGILLQFHNVALFFAKKILKLKEKEKKKGEEDVIDVEIIEH
ncbi:FxsA family protein [Nitrosophilus kaiyonis]|uniref:FxsA family protein n=1 Tax=Nitrosophilus kaiyonis TaxID=2930200 RepID=UPI002491C043|nr:FxsA family protein [Nitrosophilus kaiyonis]